MSRVPVLPLDSLSPNQRSLHALFATGERAERSDFKLARSDGQLSGPPEIWLLEPILGDALQTLGGRLRFRGVLADRAREISILRVAAAEDSAFERYAHIRAGKSAGLTDDDIATLLEHGPTPASFDESERTVDHLTVALLAGPVSQTTWDAGRAVLGEQGLFELVTLVGYYRLVALQLRAYEVGPPVGDEEETL